MNLFFDLDGTLVDAKKRLYKLFQDLVPVSQLSHDEYWNRKRSGVSHRQLLLDEYNYDEQLFRAFENKWMSLIESSHYLSMDKPIEGVTQKLSQFTSAGYLLFVVTARQKRGPVVQQIEDFGWTRHFAKVLITEQKHSKAELVYPYLDPGKKNVIIGDTGIDIECGKTLKMHTIAVLSGFLSYEVLVGYEPDHVITSVENMSVAFLRHINR